MGFAIVELYKNRQNGSNAAGAPALLLVGETWGEAFWVWWVNLREAFREAFRVLKILGEAVLKILGEAFRVLKVLVGPEGGGGDWCDKSVRIVTTEYIFTVFHRAAELTRGM